MTHWTQGRRRTYDRLGAGQRVAGYNDSAEAGPNAWRCAVFWRSGAVREKPPTQRCSTCLPAWRLDHNAR